MYWPYYDHDPDAAAPEPRGNLFEPAKVIDHQGDTAPVVVTRRRGGTPLLLTLLLTAALGGAGYYGWSHPMQGAQQADSQDAQQMQALTARLDSLEKRSGAEADEATAALSKRVDDVSGRLDAVSAKTDQLEAQSAKLAEIAAQKNQPAGPATPPADHTAQEVPGLMAQQEAADKAKLGQPAAGPQQSDVKSALDAMDQRVSKLETSAGPAQAAIDTTQKPVVAPAEMAALNDRVAKLEQAAGQPDAAAKVAGEASALAVLGDRLGKLEQANGQTAKQTEADQKARQGATATLASVSDRLGKLEQANGQNAQQADAAQKAQLGATATLASLTDRLGRLEQATGQTAQQADTAQKAQATDTQTLASLNDRVDKLEQGAGVATGAAKDATRAIQLEAAAAALQAGQPLGNLAGAPPALARYASTAPPTEAALRADFPRVADAARAVSQPDTARRSFFDRALARIQQSVVVRQGDHVVVGDPAAGVLARAQTSVAAGDLKGAADTLSVLSGPAADAVRPWVAEVRALVDARAALAAMAAHG